jgi:hypothetical protein
MTEEIEILVAMQAETDPEAFALILKMMQDYAKLYPKKHRAKLRLIASSDR